MNTARRNLGGCGTQTLALGFGGYIGPDTTATELWNGTSWTTNPTGLALSRFGVKGAGTQTAGLAAGGTPPITNSTEEFSGTVASTQTVTVS